MLVLMGVLGDNTTFMHYNARPHTARPVRSPDMNPIENVWDEMRKRLRRHAPVLRDSGEFRNILVQEWDNLQQNVIQSMPCRLQPV
ncbi:hypothetical protein QE152_g19801 [Popillia japonica]|uniref:Tc1-like transposase DDE domain-containing protein n=1 Tax=Popillia japonica TaxID=7064 RepID=A0AAW1KP64_POPJA